MSYSCAQLQLGIPLEQIIDKGELGKKNLQQLLHSLYALQDFLCKDEWWIAVDIGIILANEHIANGEPEEAYTAKVFLYIADCRERKQQMKDKYKRKEMIDFNDPLHFDQKIETTFNFKDWKHEDAKWMTEVDENGNETEKRCNTQKPVISLWKSVGDACHILVESYLPLFFTQQVLINTHDT
jgi:hypothetical protein